MPLSINATWICIYQKRKKERKKERNKDRKREKNHSIYIFEGNVKVFELKSTIFFAWKFLLNLKGKVESYKRKFEEVPK